MSWLQTHKAKFDEADAVKNKKKKEEKEALERNQSSVKNEFKLYVENTLSDLQGRKTKNGEKLSLEWSEKYNQVTLMAASTPLVQLYFSLAESESCDSDGCRWGTGEYYTQKQVRYSNKHKCRSGYDKGGDGQLDNLYDEDLAHYLLLFIDI